MNKLSLIELLEFINDSINIIRKRFQNVKTIDDFLNNDNGLEKLNSIILRIQTIGEALKNIDKHHKNFLEKIAPTEYWSNIIKLRDLISHHYIDINAEIIYMICNEKLEELQQKILKLLKIAKNK